MAEVRINVCEVCRAPDRPTRQWALVLPSGAQLEGDLCDQHEHLMTFQQFLKIGRTPRRRRGVDPSRPKRRKGLDSPEAILNAERI